MDTWEEDLKIKEAFLVVQDRDTHLLGLKEASVHLDEPLLRCSQAWVNQDDHNILEGTCEGPFVGPLGATY